MTPKEIALKCAEICAGIRYDATVVGELDARCAAKLRAFADTLPDEALVPVATWLESNRCYLQQFDRAERLVKELAAKQAHIDRLMLEYCPDEMTPEQIENWKQHQVAAAPEGDSK